MGSQEANSSTGSISGAAARSILWACCSQGVSKLTSLAMMVALARLLAPADFGLMAFALAFIMYLEMVGDLGTSAALVYWPTRQEEAARVAFFISVAMGWVWFAVTIVLAPYVATFFHTPESATILRVLAWTFPIRALGATQDALCQKRLRFGQRLIPELTQAGMKAAVAIGLALAGFGVWSLVWGQLVGVVAWTAMLWTFVGWRPGAGWPGFARCRYGAGVIAIQVTAAVLCRPMLSAGHMAGATALGSISSPPRFRGPARAARARGGRGNVPGVRALHPRQRTHLERTWRPCATARSSPGRSWPRSSSSRRHCQ